MVNKSTQDIVQDIASKVDIKSAINFFTEWQDAFFIEKLEMAHDIGIMTIANYNMLTKNREGLRDFINRGGKLRCIYLTRMGMH